MSALVLMMQNVKLAYIINFTDSPNFVSLTLFLKGIVFTHRKTKEKGEET